MVGDGHPAGRREQDDFGLSDGATRRRRGPSRGFLIGMGITIAISLAVATVLFLSGD